MKFARWTFLIASIFGLLPVIPFLRAALFDEPDFLPEIGSMGLFFYIFIVQFVCWQIFYILISRDPARYRPLMILAFFVELIGAINPIWLYFYGYKLWILIAILNILFALLFLVAFYLTGREARLSTA